MYLHGAVHGIVSGTISWDSQYDFPLLREENVTMPVFFLVQPTAPSMLLQLCFPGVFDGGEEDAAQSHSAAHHLHSTLSVFWVEDKNMSSMDTGYNTVFTSWWQKLSTRIFMSFSSYCGADNLLACSHAHISGKASTDLNQTRSNCRLLWVLLELLKQLLRGVQGGRDVFTYI